MRILILILTTVFLFSCNSENKNVSNKTDNSLRKIEEPNVENNSLKRIDKSDVEIITESNFKYDATLELSDTVSNRVPYLDGPYNINDINKFNASTIILKKEDVENFYKDDLEIIRNVIYARHGYIFKSDNFKNIFKNVYWYHPVYEDVNDKLTEIELKNINLIKRCEQYAKKRVFDR